MPTALKYQDTTRGMRGAVHVRIFDTQRDELAASTERTGNPFPSAAKARAYAMRWKTYSGDRYRIEFAEAG